MEIDFDLSVTTKGFSQIKPETLETIVAKFSDQVRTCLVNAIQKGEHYDQSCEGKPKMKKFGVLYHLPFDEK